MKPIDTETRLGEIRALDHGSFGQKDEVGTVVMHIEWDTAAECEIELLTAAEAEEMLLLDELNGSHLLVLGGSGGGGLAVEGSMEELQSFAVRIVQIVANRASAASGESPDSTEDDVCTCVETGPAPGVLAGMNDGCEVQRCDDCRRLPDDAAAAATLAAMVPGRTVAVRRDGDGSERYLVVNDDGEPVAWRGVTP